MARHSYHESRDLLLKLRVDSDEKARWEALAKETGHRTTADLLRSALAQYERSARHFSYQLSQKVSKN